MRRRSPHDRPPAERRQPAPVGGRGLEGDYGFFDAIDYTRGRPTSARRREPAPARSSGTYLAHHAGMTLVALANALIGDPMVERFHADPRVQATELLLQERVPRARRRSNRGRSRNAAWPRPPPAIPVRRFRSPHTVVSACAISLQRQLRDVRDQCGRGQQLLPWTPGDAVAPRRHARSRQPVRLPARRAERGRLVGRPIIRRPRTRRLHGRVLARSRRRSGGATTNLDAARRRGLDRGRRRSASA